MLIAYYLKTFTMNLCWSFVNSKWRHYSNFCPKKRKYIGRLLYSVAEAYFQVEQNLQYDEKIWRVNQKKPHNYNSDLHYLLRKTNFFSHPLNHCMHGVLYVYQLLPGPECHTGTVGTVVT